VSDEQLYTKHAEEAYMAAMIAFKEAHQKIRAAMKDASAGQKFDAALALSEMAIRVGPSVMRNVMGGDGVEQLMADLFKMQCKHTGGAADGVLLPAKSNDDAA
jgi:hypothetical protein